MPSLTPHSRPARPRWKRAPLRKWAPLAAILVAVGCGRKRIDLAIPQSSQTDDGGAREGVVDGGARTDSGRARDNRVPCEPGGPDVCAQLGEVCIPEMRVCGGCTSDRQCPLGRCDPSTNECVLCIDDHDCPADLNLRCNDAVHQCAVGCESSDCRPVARFGFGICDAVGKFCVACNNDADCAMQSAPAGSDLKCHNSACVECSTDADCRGGRCERHIGRCIQ